MTHDAFGRVFWMMRYARARVRGVNRKKRQNASCVTTAASAVLNEETTG
jgi:hypothetical protein